MDVDELARTVTERRKQAGLTQSDLAVLADCSVRFVGALEAGKPTVRLDKLGAVLAVLGLELRLAVRTPSATKVDAPS